MSAQQKPDFDVIAIGAGFAGMALIHYIREAGLSIKVFDKADDIGGTWTWNRYPGAMTDSESYYYCLTFSKELLQEWKWTRRYPDWKETLAYMHFVADKCDMWRDIQLNTEIASADYQKDSGLWLIKTADGDAAERVQVLPALGIPQPDPLAILELDGQAGIGGHQMICHDSRLSKKKKGSLRQTAYRQGSDFIGCNRCRQTP